MAPHPSFLKLSWTMEDPNNTNRGLAGPTISLSRARWILSTPQSGIYRPRSSWAWARVDALEWVGDYSLIFSLFLFLFAWTNKSRDWSIVYIYMPYSMRSGKIFYNILRFFFFLKYLFAPNFNIYIYFFLPYFYYWILIIGDTSLMDIYLNSIFVYLLYCQ
jgi:hypothetical protein